MHGTCNRGSDCPFSHNRQDMPSMVCTHWLKGHCAFGDKCRYDHLHTSWAPRKDDRSSSSYSAPTEVVKPAVSRLEEVQPISKLRLGGQVAHLATRPAPDAALAALQAQERRSPPPVDLPVDPFGSGEAPFSEDPAGAMAALSLQHPEPAMAHAAAHAPSSAGTAPSPLSGEYPPHWGQEQPPEQQQQHYHGSVGSYNDHYGSVHSGEGVLHDGVHASAVNPEAGGYYDESGEWVDGTAYHGGSYAAGGSRFEAFDGGRQSSEYGFSSSPGDGSTMHQQYPAWHVPGTSPGEGGEWPAGQEVGRFYATPALRSLCYDHFASGSCAAGSSCHLVHGKYCEVRAL